MITASQALAPDTEVTKVMVAMVRASERLDAEPEVVLTALTRLMLLTLLPVTTDAAAPITSMADVSSAAKECADWFTEVRRASMS
jgi:hypothetical protein